MHERSYLVTFKTEGKSPMGLDIFENMMKATVKVNGEARKAYSSSLKVLDMKPEKVISLLKNNGVTLKEVEFHN